MSYIDTNPLQGQALFNAIQANFASLEKSGGNTSSFKSNKLRGEIFDRVEKAMQPDRKYIDQYEKLIGNSYVTRAKQELNRSKRGYVTRTDRPTYSGIGWAVGKGRGGLYREFDANVIVKVTRPKKGQMRIGFEVIPMSEAFEKWGAGLAEERRAETPVLRMIMGWMKQKIINGHLILGRAERKKIKQKDTSSEIKKAEKSLFIGIALAISRFLAKQDRPPVMKDWYKLNKNKRLELAFRRDVDKKGAYYRTQIRRSIIRNINAQK